MDNFEIAPAPVSTIDGLIAKIDIIHEGIKQWMATGDDELGQIVAYRYEELDEAIAAVVGTPDHWATIDEKLQTINDLLRRKRNNDLNAMYDLN